MGAERYERARSRLRNNNAAQNSTGGEGRVPEKNKRSFGRKERGSEQKPTCFAVLNREAEKA